MSDSAIPVVAIDGPSASGKGTVARRVAAALGFHYLESGALYRLVALASLRAGLGAQREADIAALAAALAAEFRDERTLLSGEDVTEALRAEECGNRASEIARLPAVRQALLARQRAFRRPPGLVAEGRDMGTVVFPDALLKVFLTASVAVRAERRYKQLIDKGIRANLAALSRDLEDRDARDAARSVAPLIPAADAVLLDTTALTIEEAVAQVLALYRRRVGERTGGTA
ncbi:MAG: (d)CMP kinase [Burkholderiales bacterium]|nr:(d)CMP kinase [Burkholderiales bacterium]